MARFDHLEEFAHANPGHKNRHVELAGEQIGGKIERRVIVFQRHLAHRWCDNRLSAEPLDQSASLRRHAAFERDYAQAAKAGFGCSISRSIHRLWQRASAGPSSVYSQIRARFLKLADRSIQIDGGSRVAARRRAAKRDRGWSNRCVLARSLALCYDWPTE